MKRVNMGDINIGNIGHVDHGKVVLTQMNIAPFWKSISAKREDDYKVPEEKARSIDRTIPRTKAIEYRK